MDFHLSRLRAGEWLAGASAVLMVVFLWVPSWHGTTGGAGVDGWHTVTHLRWLVLVAAAGGLALCVLQALRRAPALPVTTSVVVTVIALVTVLCLLYRVALDPLAHERSGAVLELLSAVGLLGGAILSMRQEGIAPRDAPHAIPVLRLGDS